VITHTISITELVWTLFALTGLVFNGSQLVQAVRDYVFVKKNKINSIREYAATTTFLMFASWTLVQFVFVVIGFLAMLVESPNNVVSPVSYVLTMAFVVVSALLAVTSRRSRWQTSCSTSPRVA
jgi:4-hydroxybenzoate polyprenyltransferase